MNPAQPQLLTIQEAARVLNVSTKTLRRWEKAGILTPTSRTEGNQRRYTLEQVSNFQKPTAVSLSPLTQPFDPELKSPLTSHFIPKASSFSISHLLVPAQKAILASVAIFAVLFLGGFAVVKSPQLLQGVGHISAVLGFSANSFSQAQDRLAGLPGSILGSTTSLEELLFNVNVGSNFAQDVVIEGNLTAPNIVYAITAGTGVTVTGDPQNPVISATGSNAFGSVKTGSTTLSATSSGDLLTFASGSNISLSADSTTNTLTISASVPSTGFTDDGDLVRLTTSSDIVSLGSATGAAKLSLDNDTNRDIFTASQSGNLMLKLSSTGLLNVAATGFNAGIKLQNASTFFSGAGAPSNADGANGDYYFRTDAPDGNSSTYVKVAGVWVTSGGGSTTLQDAYDAGNTLTTSSARDIDFTLANTATDANFTVDIATGSTGSFQVQSNGSAVTTLDTTGLTTTGLTANGALDANGAFTLGDGGDTGAIDTSDWDISTTGDLTGIGAITADGTITFSGLASGTLYSNSGVITSEAQLDETRGGTGIGTYTTGDTLYASGTNTLAKLGIGSDGQVLTASGGVPVWAGGGGSSGSVGWWQRNLGVLSPTNITDDLAVGGTATSSAKFQVFGLSGNATTAGTLTFSGSTSQIGSTANQSLVLGTATTGNISLAPGGVIALTAVGNDVSVVDALTVGGDLEVSGGDLTSSGSSFNLLQSNVTNLSIGGAATTVSIGNSGGTITFNNATAVITGNLDVNGTSNDIAGTLNLSGNTLSSTGDLTIDPTGGGVKIGTGSPSSVDLAGDDLYVTGDLEVDGTIYGNVAGSVNLGFTEGSVTFINSSGALAQDNANFFWNDTLNKLSLTGLAVSGSQTGQALAIFNETGDQNILSASQSGISVFTVARVAGTAANGFTFTGSTTGNPITQAATGSDTNIALSIDGKGSGALNLNGTGTGDILIGGGSSSTGCTITNSTGDLACTGDLAANGGDLTTSSTGTATVFNTNATTVNIGGAANTINVAGGSGSTGCTLDGTTGDLTCSGNINGGADGAAGFWQRADGAIAPRFITDDVLVGGIATASAKFQIAGLTGNATTAGNLTFSASPTIATTALQSLTLGNSTTGNIQIGATNKLVTPAFQLTTGPSSG